jgi:hypothetical protein
LIYCHQRELSITKAEKQRGRTLTVIAVEGLPKGFRGGAQRFWQPTSSSNSVFGGSSHLRLLQAEGFIVGRLIRFTPYAASAFALEEEAEAIVES